MVATSFLNLRALALGKSGPCSPMAPRLASSPPPATTSRPIGRPGEKMAPGKYYETFSLCGASQVLVAVFS
jgi:hypothetical protein